MLKLSKKIKHGTLVAKRGDKFVRCGRGMKPFGVFQQGYSTRILTNLGWEQITIPHGIVTYGPSHVVITPLRHE